MQKSRKIIMVIVIAAMLAGIMYAPQANASVWHPPQRIPIFMYHASSEYNPGSLSELFVRPSEFERQIRHLIDNGYTFVTFDDWFNLHNIEKPVFITFDDGYECNYTEIFPILQKYNVRITIFLVTDPIGSRGRLSEDMIREMSDSGLVKFESHTLSHPRLAYISGDCKRLRNELKRSREIIEDITGRRVRAIAYPHGSFDARVIAAAREFYTFGVSTIHGKHNTALHGNFEIPRLGVWRSTTMEQFIRMLEN